MPQIHNISLQSHVLLKPRQFRLDATARRASEVPQRVVRLVPPTLHDQPHRWFRHEREGDQKQSGRHGTQYRDDVQAIGESCQQLCRAYHFRWVVANFCVPGLARPPFLRPVFPLLTTLCKATPAKIASILYFSSILRHIFHFFFIRSIADICITDAR